MNNDRRGPERRKRRKGRRPASTRRPTCATACTVAAAFLGGAFEDTIVISPRFASNDGRGCRDTLAENEVSWSCTGESWRAGAAASSTDKLTSYDFADQILRRLLIDTTRPAYRHNRVLKNFLYELET